MKPQKKRHTSLRLVLVIPALLLAASTAVDAQSSTSPPVSGTVASPAPTGGIAWQPDPQFVSFENRDLSWNDRVRLSLLASGTAPASIPTYESRLRQILAAARQATTGMDPMTLGDALLQFLHKNLFTQYQFSQTRVDVLLDTGVFNCVSSAVIYDLLAEALGLTTGAVSTTDHAFCTVTINGRTIDVETTTALGFDPGRKREFHDAFGTLTGFAYVPPGNYSLRTKLDDRGLIGLILQNRISDAQQRGDTVTPIELAWDALAIEGAAAARDLLDRTYSNYLADLNNAGSFAEGLAIVGKLESTLGTTPKTSALAAAFAQNLIVSDMDAGNFEEARSTVAQWADRTQRSASDWYGMILKDQAQQLYQSTGFQSAWQLLQADHGATRTEVLGTEASIALQEAQARMASSNLDAALSFISTLPSDVRQMPAVVQFADAVTYNLTVQYHNRFADLMNQRRVADAKATLAEGLSRFPASTILQNDQLQLSRYLQQQGG